MDEVLKDILAWIIVVVSVSSVTYTVIVGRPGDATFRLLRPLIALALLTFVLMQLLSASGLNSGALALLLSARLNLGLVVIDVAMLAAASVAWRKRRSRQAPAKVALPRQTYLALTAAVVACHWALASVYAGLSTTPWGHEIHSAPVFSTVSVEGKATVIAIFFIASLVSTEYVAWSLRKSLQRDWRVAERSRYRRHYLLALAVLPATLCVVPSLYYGGHPLLFGAIFRIATLLFAWWRVDTAPGHAEDFLAWASTIKLIKLVLISPIDRRLHRRPA